MCGHDNRPSTLTIVYLIIYYNYIPQERTIQTCLLVSHRPYLVQVSKYDSKNKKNSKYYENMISGVSFCVDMPFYRTDNGFTNMGSFVEDYNI